MLWRHAHWLMPLYAGISHLPQPERQMPVSLSNHSLQLLGVWVIPLVDYRPFSLMYRGRRTRGGTPGPGYFIVQRLKPLYLGRRQSQLEITVLGIWGFPLVDHRHFSLMYRDRRTGEASMGTSKDEAMPTSICPSQRGITLVDLWPLKHQKNQVCGTKNVCTNLASTAFHWWHLSD